MELILERELSHQQKAVDALVSTLDGVRIIKPHLAYENPTFDRKDLCLINNIMEIQKNIRSDFRGSRDEGEYLNLDVKMETGTGIDEVVVYGKIPKSSIAIPTIVGENYSPDFMYVVKKSDGTKELNVVVETKLVENKSTLRGTENAKIKCAETFFKQLTIDGYKVSFHTQLSNKKVKQIILK